MRFKRMAALGALAGSVLAGGAQAATGTATITNVHLQVFDLDPEDGVTAAITYLGDLYAHASALGADHAGSDGQWALDTGVYGTGYSAAVSTQWTSSSASTLPGTDLFGTGQGASGSASATADGVGSEANATATVLDAVFSITPHTLVVLSAQGSVSAQAQLSETVYARYYVGFEVWFDNSHTQYGAGGGFISISPNGYYDEQTATFATASFANLGATSSFGYLGAYTHTYVFGPPAVPEPTTWALLLTGALGLLARRCFNA